jgi:hypothetical protein
MKMDKNNVFGFSTAPASSGDFLPIVQYDARAGRMFRTDRVMAPGTTTFETSKTDITNIFKAICDFENIETGWMRFVAGSAPDYRLVPMGSVLPPQPSPDHKNGMRFMLKLSKECAADQPPIREIAGTAKSMVSGIADIYLKYLDEYLQNPGKLPVLMLEKTTPIKTGSGVTSSTNYHPVFKIVGWAPRGDLVFVPKAGAVVSTASSAAPAGSGGVPNAATAPTTGSTRAAAPAGTHPALRWAAPVQQMANVDDDFG